MMRLGTQWCRRAFSKRLLFGEDCQAVIGETTEEVARVAGITLGPMGRSVVIEDHKEQPRITKDGVTVVKHLEYVAPIVCRRIGLKTQFALSSRNQ
jgi:chaperonin GroEL (HSP60 family)